MQKQTTYVGLDVHARTIRVAVLGPGGTQREEWRLANEPRAVAALAGRLRGDVRGPPMMDGGSFTTAFRQEPF